MQLETRKILLTGATGGLGQAFAHRLAESGATLILQGQNQTRLAELADRLPGDHLLVAADLSEPSGIASVISLCGPRLDGLINNAGINNSGFLADATAADVIRMTQLNLLAPMLLTQGLLPTLLRSPEAMILNVGSAMGAIGYPGSAAYCSTKFGLRGFSESLRRELADTMVKVFYFAPRAVNTSMNGERETALNTELGNAIDEPEAVAEALIRVIRSDQLDYTHGSPEKYLVRLNAVLPSLVDRAVEKQLPVIKRYIGGNCTQTRSPTAKFS